MAMPLVTAIPVAATATPEYVTDLRRPFFSAGSGGAFRCFGTYLAFGTDVSRRVRLQDCCTSGATNKFFTMPDMPGLVQIIREGCETGHMGHVCVLPVCFPLRRARKPARPGSYRPGCEPVRTVR